MGFVILGFACYVIALIVLCVGWFKATRANARNWLAVVWTVAGMGAAFSLVGITLVAQTN